MIWTVFLVFGCAVGVASSIPRHGHSSRGSSRASSRGSSAWGYFTPPLIHRAPSESRQTAMDAMVELTNNLGVAILQDHSYSRGNFAFSPYGVASVLVVLYEGARGESARQIHTAVGFPADKDVIRIGFRDIHRHLRSYFSHEGYLSGISLNKDSSSLKPEYKKILRFYGYDIDLSHSQDDEKTPLEGAASEMTRTTVWSSGDKDGTATTIPPDPGNEKQDTTAITEDVGEGLPNSGRPDGASSQPGTTGATHGITKPMPGTTGPTLGTTISVTGATGPSNGTTKPMPGTTGPSHGTTISVTGATGVSHGTTISVTGTEENTTMLSTTTETTDGRVITTSGEFPNNETASETNPTTDGSSTPEGEAAQVTEGQKGASTEGDESTTNTLNSEKPTEGTSDPVTGSNESWRNGTTVTESPTQKTEPEEVTPGLDNGMLIPQLGDKGTTPTEATTTTDQTSLTTETTTSIAEESAKLGRNRKSLATQNDVKTSPKTGEDEKDMSKQIRNIVNSKVPLWLGGNTKKSNSRIKRTLTDYLKSPHSPDLSLQLQNGMFDTHVSRNADLYRSLPRLLFLVDGAVDTPVPMMTYTNVFPYAYISRLHAKALEFPLDDIRYKLLILLPVERRGLRQLIYDLGRFPLSNVLAAVRPTRVRAMVPTFMVEGFVILTSSLQKLGIWDVFDPRKANLSGMSLDPELYVRNVEQSVTVVIRNYVEILDIQTRTMAARRMENEFEATHPFLYFVLDTATNAALMAGQILDPLNSRIY